MARKKRKSSHAIVRYRAPAAAKPIIIRTTSAPTKHKKRGGRRHHGGGGGLLGGLSGGSGLIGKAVPHFVAGAATGYILKNFDAQLPTVPVIGKTGLVALAALYFGGGKPGLITEVGKFAAGLAGYQLGHDGKISGDESEAHGLRSQV